MRALALVAALAATPAAADPCADFRALLDATVAAAYDAHPHLERAGKLSSVGAFYDEPVRSGLDEIRGETIGALSALSELMKEVTRIAEQSECRR